MLGKVLRKLFSPFGVEGKEQPVARIKIAALAPIWLQYNKEFTPQKSVEETQGLPGGLSEAGPTVIHNPATASADVAAASPSSLFILEFVEPYRAIFENQGSLLGALMLIDILERHGDCPSVVQDRKSRDIELDDIQSEYDILAKVTLKEHSFTVARILLNLARETYRNFEVMVPKAVITALGHDIGKLPALRESGLYAVADHPVISARKIREIFSFSGQTSFSLTGVIEAISSHHTTEGDSWTLLLKKADGLARQQEIASLRSGLSIRPWEEWFDVQEYLSLLKPQINKMIQPNKWCAFSLQGVVYCQPSFILETARTLAARKKVLDITLVRLIDRDPAMKKIVASLREAGAVGAELGEGYFGRIFEADSGSFKKKLFVTPLKAECFGTPSKLEAEQKKEGYLANIKNMKPTMK